MNELIEDHVLPYFRPFPDEETKETTINSIKYVVRNLIKSQTAHLSKELANKAREVFILSSDNENYKQNIGELQAELMKAKQDKMLVQQEKQKQRLQLQNQIFQIKEEIDNLRRQHQKAMLKSKQELEIIQEQHRQRIKDLKKQHQIKINEVIIEERRVSEQNAQNKQLEVDEEKATMVEEANKQKSGIIKKYEEKIHKINLKSTQKIQELESHIKKTGDETKNMKNVMESKISYLENEKSRLEQQLQIESKSYKKYLQLYNSNKDQFDSYRKDIEGHQRELANCLQQVRQKLVKEQANHRMNVDKLRNQLRDTILVKDQQYEETVNIMNLEHKMQVQSLLNGCLQEKELAVNKLQVMRYEENFEHNKKYQELQMRYSFLVTDFERAKEDFAKKNKNIEGQHAQFVRDLNIRLYYEVQKEEQNSQKQIHELIRKYELELESIKNNNKSEQELLIKRLQEERTAAMNKLTNQYQAMIAELKSSQEVQMRQKTIQFQRKAKEYEKKLSGSEKKRSQQKIAQQRQRMQMQMKIDSMIDVSKDLEKEVFQLQDKIMESQNQRSRIVSEYELKIILLKNEMQQIRDESSLKEEQLKDIFEQKIQARDREIARTTDKLKKQAIQLITKHNEKTQNYEKQYSQLKKLVLSKQKTSLPEDIQALRILHSAFIKKEQELNQEKALREQLQREIKAKDAADKIFASKGFQIRNIRSDHKFTPYQSHQN